jgi:hypothetical protein
VGSDNDALLTRTPTAHRRMTMDTMIAIQPKIGTGIRIIDDSPTQQPTAPRRSYLRHNDPRAGDDARLSSPRPSPLWHDSFARDRQRATAVGRRGRAAWHSRARVIDA